MKVAEEVREVWGTGCSLGGERGESGHTLEKGSERGHCQEAFTQICRNNRYSLLSAKITFQ